MYFFIKKKLTEKNLKRNSWSLFKIEECDTLAKPVKALIYDTVFKRSRDQTAQRMLFSVLIFVLVNFQTISVSSSKESGAANVARYGEFTTSR